MSLMEKFYVDKVPKKILTFEISYLREISQQVYEVLLKYCVAKFLSNLTSIYVTFFLNGAKIRSTLSIKVVTKFRIHPNL
jgi:hypothetical protein